MQKKTEIEKRLAECETPDEAIGIFYDCENEGKSFPGLADISIARAVELAQTPMDAMHVFREGDLAEFNTDAGFEKALILCKYQEELADEIMEYFCDSGNFALYSKRYILKIFARSEELSPRPESEKHYDDKQSQHACSH